ncbi:MAG TPA: type II secretion system F family protein [Gemmataceae bacterium]|jgi:tight adherence protein B|nr:type II secretion system F family protein [Gemmataceae bacterium]
MGLPVFIFLAVAFSIVGGYYALTAVFFRDATRIRRRVQEEFRKDAPGHVQPSPLFKDLDKPKTDSSHPPFEPAAIKPTQASTAGTATLLAKGRTLQSRLRKLLRQADVPISVQQLLMISAALGLVCGLAATLFRGPLLGLGAAALGISAPLFYVRQRCQRRREKLLAQLPGAFDLMARVIRAGQSVPQALQAVADSLEGQLAAEFSRCQKQQSLGLRPEATFQELAERTGILEMRIFVMAMILQRQTGGNLSEILTRLATLVRERLRLHRQVRALTAEGRLQGLTLVILPFVLFAALMVVNRNYAEVILQLPHLLLATGALMVAGVLWIRRITRFDV